MTKKPRKINLLGQRPAIGPVLRVPGTGGATRRLVLGVPKKRKFVAMADVEVKAAKVVEPKRMVKRAVISKAEKAFVPSVPSDPFIPLLLELIPETDVHYKPQTIRLPRRSFRGQPLISSFIIKQKNRFALMPRAATVFKLTALTLLCMVVSLPAMSAFEAHIVNVTAQLKEITPPTLTPPGDSVAWDNTDGGTGLSGNTNVVMSDPYAGAPFIYYTFGTPTLDSSTVPDPICGQTGPNGGGGDKTLPQQLTINADAVIKAIACDGTTNTSHSSYVNTKIYSFGQQVTNLVINEFLPNPTDTPSGNQGAVNGHLTNNGGEWVELFNNGTTTIDTDGFVLYDNFVPSPTPSSNTWTTTGDFNLNPAPTQSSTTVASGNVLLTPTSLSGSFEKVFDIGINKKASWGNLSMATTQTDPAASICAAVATSDDGVTYTPYTDLSPCANSATSSVSSSLASLPNSRFIKWKTNFNRADATKTVNLNSLTISYNFTDYNTYHELVITSANTNTGGTLINPGAFLVVYRDGNPNFNLDTQVNAVSLYDGHLFLGANLIDSHVYDFGGPIPMNKSFARIPDGSSNWVDPCPTPGMPNIALGCDVVVDGTATTTASSTLDVLPAVTDVGNGTSTLPDATSTITSNTPPDASSTPDSGATTTPNTLGSGGSGNATSTADQASTTPDSNASSSDQSNIVPSPTPTPTPTPVVTGPFGPASTSTPTDTSSTTPPPQDPPADSGAPKQSDAIVPPASQSGQDQGVLPAPISGSGDGSPPPPPPDPGAGPDVSTSTVQ